MKNKNVKEKRVCVRTKTIDEGKASYSKLKHVANEGVVDWL